MRASTRRPVDRRLASLAVVAFLVFGCGSTSNTAPGAGASTSGVAQGATSAPASGAVPTDTPEPTPAPDPQTAADLIQADVAAGKLDQPTGLLYRLEAEFGAPGLPSQYASAPPSEDQAALDMAALDMAGVTSDKIPAAIHDQLLPFLLRPTDARSVFHGTGTPAALNALTAQLDSAQIPPAAANVAAGRAAQAGDIVSACGADGWESIVSATIPVTVWGACGESGRNDADLTRAMSAIESTYPGEVSLMGDPIPDDGTADAGGSTNIDIYLVDTCVTREGSCVDLPGIAAGATVPTSPYPGSAGSLKSSAFILVYRGYASSPTDIKSILAHEMFHVLEDAHNTQGRSEGGHSYWMTEASAKWAEEFFVPEGRAEWVYPWFNVFQATAMGLTTSNGTNEYRSFAWPYFMDEQMSPQAIADAWKAFEGKVGWNALNEALTGILSLKDHFKDFALAAWNTAMPGGGGPDLVSPKFQKLDAGFPGTPPNKPVKFYFRHPPSLKLSDPAIKVPEDMPPLSARYAELELDDSTQQLIVDFSGLQPYGAMDVVALVHIKGGQWQKRDLPPGKTTFCRSDENVDRVLFVLDDHSYSSSDEVSGTWQYQAVSDACTPGSFTVAVANVGMGTRPGPGTYSGRAPVDCSETNNLWLATFVDKNGIDNVHSVTIAQQVPPFTEVSTTFNTADLGDWSIQQGLGSTVAITVDDQGTKVTISVHAVDLYQKIDATLKCGSILRG
jgi:hypothetical protein